MKIVLNKPMEFEVTKIVIDAGVRYWEDADVNGIKDEDGTLIPCRENDRWKPIIDIETGKVLNWEIGKTADIHYKVCDDGVYSLISEKHGIVFQKDGYVPIFLDLTGESYGDYLIMKIDENGMIKNWDKEKVSDFFENYEKED